MCEILSNIGGIVKWKYFEITYLDYSENSNMYRCVLSYFLLKNVKPIVETINTLKTGYSVT